MSLIIKFLRIIFQQVNTLGMIFYQKTLLENNLQKWQIYTFW